MTEMHKKLGEAADDRLEVIDGLIEKALIVPKRLIKLLVAAVVVLTIALGVSTYVGVMENNLAHGLQQDSITSCQNANSYRAAQTAIWLDLFRISNANNPKNNTPKNKKLQQEFVQYIEKTNAPHDCATQYGK